MLRTIGALPTEQRVKDKSSRDYLWCALNLLLDQEEEVASLCPACRAEAEKERCPVCGAETGGLVQEQNESFDWERFEKLKGGSV